MFCFLLFFSVCQVIYCLDVPSPNIMLLSNESVFPDLVSNRGSIVKIKITVDGLGVETMGLYPQYMDNIRSLFTELPSYYMQPMNTPGISQKLDLYDKIETSAENIPKLTDERVEDNVFWHLKVGGNKCTNNCLEDADNLVELVYNTLKNSGKYWVILITGGGSHTHKHISKRATSDLPGNKFYKLPCAMIHISSAYIKIGSALVELGGEPVVNSSDICDANATHVDILMEWTGIVQESIKLQSVIAKFVYDKEGSSWKQRSSIKLEGTVENRPVNGNYTLESDVYSPESFSYACSRIVMETSKSGKSPLSLSLVLDRFQVEPFVKGANAFSKHWDCATFFTVPIWSGIFASFILVSVLVWSISMLASVPTMDKWDSVRGQTLQVPTSE